ncbi:MAG: fibronectin type III domain-containing protein [Bacteroidaceae bacterium]|nr:fibronectin type III domain-containing protein [Bacteroidaceae bacterium]
MIRTATALLLAVFSATTMPIWAEVKSYIDVCKGGLGEVCISGWVYDTDRKSYETSDSYGISVRAVVSTSSSNDDLSESNKMEYLERSDVNSTYGLTGKHGFKTKVFAYPHWFGLNSEMTVNVKIYATIGKGYYANPNVVCLKNVDIPVRINYGYGTEEFPYIISSAADWDLMADPDLAPFYADSYIRMANMTDDYYNYDNSTAATKPFGTSTTPFAGHFDGRGQTLNVNLSGSTHVAPFAFTNGATIKNLTVGGTVNSSQYAGGIVGHGGSSTLTLQNCICAATISGFTKYAAGILGWCDDLTLNIKNCLFKGSFSPGSGGKYHPIALKYAPKTVTAHAAVCIYYLNTTTPSEGLDNNAIIGAGGFPLSTTFVDGVWDDPITFIDGQTYYTAHFTGKTLAYEYGFENNDLSSEGWTMVGCDGNTHIWGAPSRPIHSGGLVFDFSRPFSSNANPQYLISPEFNGHDPILVQFYYAKSGNTGEPAKFQVGYSTSTPDIEAFTWGEMQYASSGWVWNLYEETFTKGTKYIAIRCFPDDISYLFDHYGGFNNLCLSVDDFTFTACDTPSPISLMATDITEYTASLSWESPVSDHPITGYTYKYRKASDAEYSDDVTVPATTTSATIDNLSADTDYEFRVKALYGVHGESIFAPTGFTTATELPYEWGFENGLARWNLVDFDWEYGGVRAEAAYNNDNGFRFVCCGHAQYLISPRFAGTDAMDVSFYYRKKNINTTPPLFQVGYSTTTSDPSAFIWDEEISATEEWTLYEHVFPAVARFIAVRYNSVQVYSGESNIYYAADNLYIDDFSFVEYSAYAKPTDIAVSNLTDQSAQLTWTAPNGATSYAYQYKMSTENAWSAVATTTDASVTLDGLEANTNYIFRVKALYAGSNASNYETVRFLTEGPTVTSLPFTEGFENGMGGWRISGSSSKICSRNSSEIPDGNYSFELYQNEALISPQLDVSTPMWVTFYYKHFYGTYFDGSKEVTGELPAGFIVGFSTKTKNLSDFRWGTSTMGTTVEWNNLTCYCPEGTKYVAVKWQGGYDIYLDDFTFTEYTGLSVPHDIAVNNITAFSADLSWSGDTKKYNIRFRQKADDGSTDLYEWKTATTSEHDGFNVYNLSPNTKYEFQVQSCLYNMETSWSDVFTFTTNRIVPLNDDKDNTVFIDIMADTPNSTYDVMLVGRTLYKNGIWNTLCLPFSVGNLIDTPLEGATVKTLSSTALSDDGKLSLNFTDATSIEAGRPYLVKWDLPTPNLIIRSAADWETFAQNVNNGTESYQGKLVQLATDISVSTMAGTAEHPFRGTFDGAGYTLDLSISGAEYAAPFSYINGATVCNLKVTGSVNGGQYCAGIVGAALDGTNNVHNCWMAASVTSQGNHIGGVMGHGTTSTVIISNCFLNGTLTGNDIGVFCGGGSNGGSFTAETCWESGTYNKSVNAGSLDLILTDNGVTVSITNCTHDNDGISQGTDNSGAFVVVIDGTTDYQYRDFLGSQWTLNDNGGLALKHTTDVANITSPVFKSVHASTTITPVQTEYVDFIGSTSPFTLTANDRSVLFLGAANTLYWPDADKTIGACRAYFQLKNGLEMGDGSNGVKTFLLNFDGEDETTGIAPLISPQGGTIHSPLGETEGASWHDLSGRRLSVPSASSVRSGLPRGIYINNGKKIVIK